MGSLAQPRRPALSRKSWSAPDFSQFPRLEQKRIFHQNSFETRSASILLPSTFYMSAFGESTKPPLRAGRRGTGTKSLVVRVPAVATNLGPGFDSVALALNAYSTVTVEILPHPEVNIPMVQLSGAIRTASDAKSIGNLVYTLISKVCTSRRHLLQRLKILVESDLPLNKGLGVFDGIVLAAIYAVNSIEDLVLGQAELLAQSMSLEARGETVAACLLGDLVVSAQCPGRNRVITQQLHWPQQWQLFCLLPPYCLDTPAMRQLIPAVLPTTNVLGNLQRLSLFLAAVSNANDQALREGMKDLIHEPYRRHCVPELDSLRSHLLNAPILGCVLSGAGSAILVIYHIRHNQRVEEAIKEWLEGPGKDCALLSLRGERRGMLDLSAPQTAAGKRH